MKSDEILAEWIVEHIDTCPPYLWARCPDDGPNKTNCKKCWLDWAREKAGKEFEKTGKD